MLLKQTNVGSKLIDKLYSVSDKSDKNNRFVKIPGIPTGFNVYDIYTGFLCEDMFGRPIINGGLYPRLCNIIGESATGKTSYMVKSTAKAVDYVWNRFGQGYSEMFFYDSEGHTPDFRVISLTGWSPADFMNKCNYSDEVLSLIKLANQIIKIYDIKKKYAKDFLLPSGIRGLDGKEVLFMAPTFICVDSVASINPDGVEDLIEYNKAGEMKDIDALSSNTDGMRDAKAWTVFVRKIKPFLDEANISLYCINHKTKENKMSMFEKEKRYLPFLAMGEKLKGGHELIFQSFNILDFSSSEKINERNPVYGDNINGFISKATIVKSKTNIEGVSFPMVYDMRTGHRAELSDFEYLWQQKFGISGAMKINFDILPEIQFTRKTLLSTLEEFPALGRALSFTTKYKASYEMLYYQKAPSLQGIENVPLERRLAMLYNFTKPYNESDLSTADTEHLRIANENRHYISFDMMSDELSNNLLKENHIEQLKDGYMINCEEGATPFDLENTRDGLYCYPKSQWDKMKENIA